MRIIGIGYFVAHDSSIGVILGDGVEFAVSEERLSRKKRDGRFPDQALACAKHGAFDAVVAPYCDAQLFKKEHRGIVDVTRQTRFAEAQEEHEKTLRDAGVTEFLGHHLSHAAGAFYTSGFSEAIVITYDGGIVCEPWLATVWLADGGRLKPIRRITRLDGATAAIRYSGITSLLGFRPVHDEGKVTGLAARGNVNGEVIETLERAFDQVSDPAAYYDGRFSRQFAAIRETHQDADIAASIQAMTEDAVVSLIRESVPDPSRWDCVMAGGLFSNVRLNLRVKRMGFKRIYVYPAMGDEGLSIGAAIAYAVMRGFKPPPLTHVFFGPEYMPSEIVSFLDSVGLGYEAPADIEVTVARLLANGKLVGRFDGRCEFGPRALGNRSILYQATDPSVNIWLNKKLGRSETMPFAPATLSDGAAEMFHDIEGLERCTPFMTTLVSCTDKMRHLSPAVVHVDGTARPQIVSSDANASFHRILSEYYLLTGLPSLINTSFNLHGEPIVCSPYDAVRCFLKAGLDYLAIGNYLVEHPALRSPKRSTTAV